MSLGLPVGDFVTVALLVVLEGVLSADNALVMAMMILGLPAAAHRRALSYGLVGAFLLRLIATFLAIYLIRIAWVKLAGGAYLLYLSGDHFVRHRSGSRTRPQASARGWLGLSPFWATVVSIELVNLAFSCDSILVAVAMSPKLWVVLSGGMLGIVAMRAIVGQLVKVIQRFPALVDGAFVVIAWVAAKLIQEYTHQIGWMRWEIPQVVSLAVIALIGAASFAYARHVGPRAAPPEKIDPPTAH